MVAVSMKPVIIGHFYLKDVMRRRAEMAAAAARAGTAGAAAAGVAAARAGTELPAGLSRPRQLPGVPETGKIVT